MPKSLKSSGESQFEYDSQWDSADDDDQRSQSYDDNDTRSVGGQTYLSSYQAGDSDDPSRYLAKADQAMSALEELHSAGPSAWKRALKHRSGCVVWVTKDKRSTGPSGGKGNKNHLAPVFKGELDILNYSPVAVFGVVGTRKLWDDWYKEGNLVQNLSEDSSLTYTCMKGITGSSTRDLSLVEKVKGTHTGTIMFASTSVVTPLVPRVAGRVRASIALNGWVLEPIQGGTKLTYYLHVNVKTFVPAFAATKYLARRPTCIAKIEEYLRQNGPPPMAGVDPSSQSPSPSQTSTMGGGGGVIAPRQRRNSTSSRRSTRSSGSGMTGAGGALPVHVKTNEEASSFNDIQKGSKVFQAFLGQSTKEWTNLFDQNERMIFLKKRDGGDAGLPTVRGECVVEGVTTEMVLGTIRSEAARRIWDVRYAGTSPVQLDNGFDQGVFVESQKAIYPTLGARHYIIASGVEREDPTSDHSTITLISRSTKAKASSPSPDSTKGQLDFAGWQLTPHSATSVKIEYIAQLSPTSASSTPLTPSVQKCLITELAAAPSKVAEFIDDYGHAPFFVRWSDGPAQLDGGSTEGQLKEGVCVFRINGEGSGTMKDGQQKCWLQWSEKMYERGVDVSVEPEGAATLGKVEGMERTVEFVWTQEVKEGATIVLKRAEGDGAEDLFVNGEYLDKTVAMEKGTAARRKGTPAPPAKTNGKAKDREVSPSSSEESDEAPRNTSKSQANGKSIAPIAAAGAAAGVVGGAVAATARSAKEAVTPVQVQQRGSSLESSSNSSVAGGKVAVKDSPFPDDACLIISKDLYFTRTQVAFIFALVSVSFLFGKIK